jgi:hypothetical protein
MPPNVRTDTSIKQQPPPHHLSARAGRSADRRDGGLVAPPLGDDGHILSSLGYRTCWVTN